MKELQAIVRALASPRADEAVLATLATVEGSSYRRPGARLLLFSHGQRIGSISGGCLEEDVLVRARTVLANGQPETVVYDTTSENDLVWGVGLGCHGVVRVVIEKLPPQPAWVTALAENFAARRPTLLAVTHETDAACEHRALGTQLVHAELAETGASEAKARGVFLENVSPPTALTIYGAGDDAQPLAHLAQGLGWHVTIGDPRAAFATRERFPSAERIVVAPAGELVARTAPDASTLAVVMTHHYVHDVPLLKHLLARPLAYLGLLGPKKRAEKILGDLASEGQPITAETRARLHAPVGLDLGADSPEQVALSILAEMQAVLTRRDARPLRERNRPIHE
jgi:xanthine dehydrogenase accessory factor